MTTSFRRYPPFQVSMCSMPSFVTALSGTVRLSGLLAISRIRDMVGCDADLFLGSTTDASLLVACYRQRSIRAQLVRVAQVLPSLHQVCCAVLCAHWIAHIAHPYDNKLYHTGLVYDAAYWERARIGGHADLFGHPDHH